MTKITQQIVLNKYLSETDGFEIILIPANNEDGWEISDVFFHHRSGNVAITQNVGLAMLSLRNWGDETLNDWIDELLPDYISADTFTEDADKAYSDSPLRLGVVLLSL